VIGLSKVPRVIDVFAHRLQLQERLTEQIAGGLQEVTSAAGVAVVLDARHLCMEMRGVERAGGVTRTACFLGSFVDDDRARSEFLDSIRG
jgi:GTP cyclohydrolase I